MSRSSSLVSSNNSLNPFNVFRNEMERFFDNFATDVEPLQQMNLTPKIEWRDNGDNYVLCAEIPGMDEKDINVSMRDDTLIIEGEKKSETKNEKNGVYQSEISYGSFYRAIPLSNDIKTESISATYRNGMLEVKLEKNPEVARTAKKIPINTGKQDVKTEGTKH